MPAKKLLYFTVIDVEEKSFAGVAKKVLGQVEAFEELGLDTYLLCFASSQQVLLHNGEKIVFPHHSLCGFHRCLQLYSHLRELCQEQHFDYLYIRYPLCDWWFYRALKKSRPKIGKVILEIPTYPIDDENNKNNNLVSRFCFWQDKHLRYKLHSLVDLIVTYGDVQDKQIWNIPVIVIYNSVPAKSCRILPRIPHDTINIIAVANIMFHHRYDKVLRGIAEYLKKPESDKRIRFHIVGNGPEKANLQQLTKELEIQDYVVFHGILTGKELDKQYQISDLGLVGFNQVSSEAKRYKFSSLKYPEYCSIGLPHSGCAPHLAYPENSTFFHAAKTTETSIDIGLLVDFIKSCNLEKAQEDMLEVVSSQLTWEHSMKEVLKRCE